MKMKNRDFVKNYLLSYTLDSNQMFSKDRMEMKCITRRCKPLIWGITGKKIM